MKAKYLASLLMQYPEFEVEFSFFDSEVEFDNKTKQETMVLDTLRQFRDIEIDDIGHSDKVIKLGGVEK